jgi:hypothetical protein
LQCIIGWTYMKNDAIRYTVIVPLIQSLCGGWAIMNWQALSTLYYILRSRGVVKAAIRKAATAAPKSPRNWRSSRSALFPRGIIANKVSAVASLSQ